MPQNFYELVWIFVMYAFIGWCLEVSYQTVNHGVFINRGFLNGPYCPIYGCGGVIVIVLLYPLRQNMLLLFVGSALLASVLELITGFVLEKVFHNKWWDYSNVPFNIHGYVCLKFSLYWGIGGVMAVAVVHPMLYWLIVHIPHILGVVIVSIIMVGFTVDVIVTVAIIQKFNKRLKLIDETAQKIHKISDSIGTQVFENTENLIEKSEEFKETHSEMLEKLDAKKDEIKAEIDETTTHAKNSMDAKKAELQELQEKYKELFTEKNLGFRRLMRAFPGMISTRQNEALEKYKEHFQIKVTSRRKDD